MGEKTSVNVDTRSNIEAGQTAPNDRAGRVGEQPPHGKADCQPDDVANRQAQGEQRAAEPAWQGVPL